MACAVPTAAQFSGSADLSASAIHFLRHPPGARYAATLRAHTSEKNAALFVLICGFMYRCTHICVCRQMQGLYLPMLHTCVCVHPTVSAEVIVFAYATCVCVCV